MVDSASFPSQGMSAAAVSALLRDLADRDAAAVRDVGFAKRFFAAPDVSAIAAEAYGIFAHAGRVSPYPGLPQPPCMAQMQR